MKIFLSYGHDFQEEAARLAEGLKKLGYEVWIDYEGIVAGDDWREKITENILSSDYVLALLSRYGLRENGVCLNELAIALRCNRRNIRPVKMEAGVEKLAPSAISGIQFFDLSEWRAVPEALFEDWFGKKLSDLVNTSFTRATEYERRLQVIKNRLHYAPQFSREIFDLGRDFRQRGWLDAIIHDWIRKDNSPLCFLIGFPGFGKSCFCMNYYHYSSEVAGLVICGKDKENNTARVIREISFQLAVRIPSFATRLEYVLNAMTVSIGSMSNEELFDSLLLEPLNIIDGDMETTIIIVDGVDIYSSNGENELVDLFYEKLRIFPNFVKFLFTTRKDDAVISGGTDIFKVYVSPDDERVFSDIQAYVFDSIKDACATRQETEQISGRVAENAQGSFLYASVVSEGLRSGSMIPQDIDQLPNKVADVYYRWLKQIVPIEEYAKKYSPAISLLAALDNPPLDLIKNALHWRRSELQGFISRFSVLFIRNTNKLGDACVSFYCASFGEWIKDSSRAANYAVYEEDGVELVADYMIDAYEEDELTDYDRLEIIPILKRAKQKKMLRTLGSDTDFYKNEFALIEKLQENPDYYDEWTALLDELHWLSARYEEGSWHMGGIAYYHAKGEFICGDLIRCGEILDEALSSIKASGVDRWYMDSLYMAGTICDYRGERDKSVGIFNELFAISKDCSPENSVKALAGLIWNDHFNNLNEGLRRLEALSAANLSKELSILKDLITARMLLSSGKMNESLALFGRVLDAEESGLWGFDIVARKNQMLTIESIVAAYDCGDFPLAIKYGEYIYEKIQGAGSVPECYCLSWLSLAYYKYGLTERAQEHLGKAKAVFNHSCESSSLWLKMHLSGIEAKYLFGSGDGAQSAAAYQAVESMAETCGDVWVRGAACFNIVAIGYDLDIETDADHRYANTLRELAARSQLPHLLYKTDVVKLILADSGEAAQIIGDYTDIPRLPDVDVRFISKLLLKKARAIGWAHADVFKQEEGRA